MGPKLKEDILWCVGIAFQTLTRVTFGLFQPNNSIFSQPLNCRIFAPSTLPYSTTSDFFIPWFYDQGEPAVSYK